MAERSLKLTTKAPKDGADNGLNDPKVVAAILDAGPEQLRVGIVVFDVAEEHRNRYTGDVIGQVSFRRIEPVLNRSLARQVEQLLLESNTDRVDGGPMLDLRNGSGVFVSSRDDDAAETLRGAGYQIED